MGITFALLALLSASCGGPTTARSSAKTSVSLVSQAKHTTCSLLQAADTPNNADLLKSVGELFEKKVEIAGFVLAAVHSTLEVDWCHFPLFGIDLNTRLFNTMSSFTKFALLNSQDLKDVTHAWNTVASRQGGSNIGEVLLPLVRNGPFLYDQFTQTISVDVTWLTAGTVLQVWEEASCQDYPAMTYTTYIPQQIGHASQSQVVYVPLNTLCRIFIQPKLGYEPTANAWTPTVPFEVMEPCQDPQGGEFCLEVQ